MMKNKLVLTLLAGIVSSTAMVSTANASEEATDGQQVICQEGGQFAQ